MSDPGRGRIAHRWGRLRAAGRPGLIAYVTAGYPSADATVAVLRGLAGAGADFVEVGIPFSDPLADGPVIQRASFAALQAGTTVAGVLDMVRSADVAIPVVLFSYLNPVLRYGLPRFLEDARAAGASGLLLTDLPVGADPPIETAIVASGLDRIPLVALTTTPARLAAAVRGASGFVYLISRLGVTGGGTTIGADVTAMIAALRAATPLPIALGFGIGTGAEAAAAAAHADGVVVGSALVSRMTTGPEAVVAFIAELRHALDAAAVAA